MKKIIFVLIILGLASSSYAMSVGGPDMSVPEKSLYTKEKAVDAELDKYEFNMNVRTGVEAELIFDRDLDSAEADTTSAKLKGQNYMIKFSNNFYDVIEPYIKIGTSNLKAEWDQFGRSVEIEADPGFMWAMGARAILADIEDYNVKVSLDVQFRSMDTEIDTAELDGASQSSIIGEEFKIDEWQISLMASKKYVVPFSYHDYYAIPYGGITYSLTDIDVSFTDPSNNLLYSLFNADDDREFGLVLGVDVMPSLASWYLFNIEMKFLNEFALTLGSTIKF
ncbi:MAG: hypothetical protein ABH848_02755 [Candidatus Omnitrophota bacterium]